MQTSNKDSNASTPASGAEDVFVFPATLAQRRFWLLDQLVPGNSALNEPLAARLVGSLDRARLEQAVNELIRRHEMLRTSFRTLDNEAVQVIHPSKTIQLDWFDITHLPDAEKEREVRRLMLVEAERPFSLSEGPLLRGGCIKVRQDEHVILLTMHQIGCDGWSDGILIRELAQIYSTYFGAEPLAELPLQYVDYAQWQKEWLSSPAALEQRQYWKSALKGVLPTMNLPTDRPRRSGRSYTSDMQSLLLPSKLADAVRDLCNREDVTPYMLFLSCYGILLSRYSGAKDLVVGTPASNRNQTELEGLIGRFANPLVLRLDLSGKPTFRTFLSRIKELCIGAFSHQSFPFELLLEEIKTDPHRMGTQFLQAYFVCQKDFVVPQKMAGVTLTPMDSTNPGAMFELTFAVIERSEGIRVQLEFNTDLYDASTAQRMINQFVYLLEQAAVRIDEPLDQVQLLTPEEYDRQVVAWNSKTFELPRDLRIHQEFEQQVQRTPQAIALQDGNTSWTYQQLNARSNQIAQSLRAMGVGPGSRVALFLKPASVDFVAGFLAVLKAGGCSALFPSSRSGAQQSLSHRWDEAQISAILGTSKTLSDSIPAGIAVLSLDEDEKGIRGASTDNLSSVVLADQPAVFRWERRTHTPVVFSQKALSNATHAVACGFRLHPADRVAFDEEDWLAALFAGACLVFPPDFHEFRSRRWQEWIDSQSITVVYMEGPGWHELAHWVSSRSESPIFPSLRLTVLLGDSVSPAAYSAWERLTSGRVRLVRAYRAEGVLGTIAMAEMSVANGNTAGLILTTPFVNLRCYVLDQALQNVPAGVPGEVYVGGESLASADSPLASVSLPTSSTDRAKSKPADRLIPTGDRGRFVPGRGLEWVGRVEDIAKTHQFSLELTHLKSVLYSHPSVWEAVVLLREVHGKSTFTLIAYVVTKTSPAPSGVELRTWLEGQVPAYMVPELVVALSEFPLNAHGAIDLDRLPISAQLPAKAASQYVAPRTNLEKTIVEVWESVLGVERVGIHDDFFALGGQSLAAMRLFARLYRITGKNVPLVTLFQCRTVEKLAQALESGGYELLWKNLVSIKPSGTRPPFYCVHGVGGNILEFEHMARYMDSDQPLYGIQAQGLDGRLPRHGSVQEMATHYIKQIREFQPEGPYYFGGSSFGGLVAYEMARQLEALGQSVGILVMFDTWAPGHPQYLPSTSELKRRINYWRLRIELHFSNFWLSQGSARIEYLKKKASTLYTRWRRRSLRWLESMRSRFHPEAIRAVREAGHGALERYQPLPYNGVVTLLRASEQPRGIVDDRTNGWGGLVRMVETTDVPGHHGSMMEDPRAKVLVEKLTARLIAAQSRGFATSNPNQRVETLPSGDSGSSHGETHRAAS